MLELMWRVAFPAWQTMVDTVLKSMSKERAVDEPIHFDALIVDEAAQAVEVSTLIPLKYQPDAMVLVGDPGMDGTQLDLISCYPEFC